MKTGQGGHGSNGYRFPPNRQPGSHHATRPEASDEGKTLLTMQPRFDDLASTVDSEIREVLSARSTRLYDIMAYHLGWEDAAEQTAPSAPGDRRHGVLCLVACQAAGGDVDSAMPAAAAVELVDKFCQIHDDVQGGKPKRDNRDAVWWVWGPAQAINAGDGMHALARLSLFRLLDRGVEAELAFRAVQVLDEASLRACEGRFLDLQAQERVDVAVESYFKMATDKEGALYGCALELGAVLAGAGDETVRHVRQSGLDLGVALQIKNDLAELSKTASASDYVSGDLMNKKKLLPIVMAFETGAARDRRRLGDVYFKRVLEPGDLDGLATILDELGTIERSRELLVQRIASARSSLEASGLESAGIEFVGSYIDSLMEA
ncbi:MAG: hypothetical protein CL694_07520 [Chloroflexi bacterium]|nr:hypothetical protein [Chloroflexota bacterium]